MLADLPNVSISRALDSVQQNANALVPWYLPAYYWWAYIHPHGVKIFERQWLANLILLGNYARLRDEALHELGNPLSGSTLQVACAYGDLSTRLARNVEAGFGKLDVVDVLPIQLKNLYSKLPQGAPVRLLQMDSSNLELPDANYDQVLVFFLLHEQPRLWRERTLVEISRVVKQGGKIVIVDYAKPHWWNPLNHILRIVLAKLEPFALDLWCQKIENWIVGADLKLIKKKQFFGGLYQMVVVRR